MECHFISFQRVVSNKDLCKVRETLHCFGPPCSRPELCAMECFQRMLNDYGLASYKTIFTEQGYHSLQDLEAIDEDQVFELRYALAEKGADRVKLGEFFKALRSRVNQPIEEHLHFYSLAHKINSTDVSGLDESTVLRVDIDPLNEHEDNIHVPQRVQISLTQTSSTDPVPVVWLVGPTGAGKSFIASSCCRRDGVAPLVASPDQHVPTSAHVCVHRAAIHAGSKKATPILLFDSEGEDGRVPKTLLEMGMRKLYVRMRGMTEDALQQQMEYSTARRQKVIKEHLPPIAYLLSDVVVFIDTVEPRRTERVERIKQFARQAHEAVSSLGWRPSLILLQNKWVKETDNAAFNVSNELDWLVADLSKVFFSVAVLRIAHSTERHVFEASLNEFHNELLRMVSEVHSVRRERGVLFSELEFWLNFKPLVMQLKSPDQLCMSMEHLVSRNRASVSAADNALHAFDMLKGGQSEIGPDRFQAMAREVLLWYAYSQAGEARRDRIDEESWKKRLRTTYDNVLSLLQGNEPCSATVCHNGETYRCTQLSKGHESQHRNPVFVREQSQNLLKRFVSFGLWKDWVPCVWNGEFEPSKHVATSYEQLEENFNEFLSQDVKAYVENFPIETEKLNQSQSKLLESFETCWLCLRKVSEQINLQNRNCRHLLCRQCLMTRMMLLGPENTVVVCPFCKRESDGQAHSSQGNDKGFRILSLDGGGVRGIVEVLVLKRLEEVFSPLPITSLFDVIIGTSAGGLVAMALLKGVPLSTLEEKLENLAEDFFSPSFFGKLWTWLCNFLANTPLCETSSYKTVLEKMLGDEKLEEFRGERPPYVFCVAFDIQKEEPVILGNYPRQFQYTKLIMGRDVSTSLAAQCTSAAPVFFEPVEVDLHKEDGSRVKAKIVDGGVRANCPAALGVKAAKELQCESKGYDDIFVESIASIGTGLPEPSVAATDMNALKWAEKLIDIATNSQFQWEQQIEYVEALQSRPRVRVNPPRLGSLDAFSGHSVPKLTEGMEDYFDSEVGKEQMGKLIHMTYAKLWEVKQEAGLTAGGPGVNFRIEMQDPRCDFNGMENWQLADIIRKRGQGLEEKHLQNWGKDQLCREAQKAFKKKPFDFDFKGRFGYLFAGVEHELDDGRMEFNLEHHKAGAPELDVFWRSSHGDFSLCGLPRLVRVTE